MNRLIDDLLWLAREDARASQGPQGSADLRYVITEACTAAAPIAAERGVEIRVHGGDHALVVSADAESLRRLLLLLLDNALKYTPAGGTVDVSLTSRDGSATVSVRDTGIGIRQEDLPFVFDRFWRADKARTRGHGTGLGLSIAQKIAATSGGRLEAESLAEQGAIFSVVVPVAAGAQAGHFPVSSKSET